MERFKYRAINAKGRSTRGVISAANETDLYEQLSVAGLELVQCQKIKSRKSLSPGFLIKMRVNTRDMVQIFLSLDQMQGAGVSMLDSLADIRDSLDNETLRDIMSEIWRDVSEGSALSEAMARHPLIFSPLYVSLIAAGEETGNLNASYQQLIKFLSWKEDLERKVKKAKRYPIILGCVIIGVVGFMMTLVVPQVVGFIENIGQDLPFYTIWLMHTSDFFVNYWWLVLPAPFLVFFLIKVLSSMSSSFAYQVDQLFLSMPIAGPLVRKINIARFSQTFGALYSSGIDVLKGLRSAQETVTNLALNASLEGVYEDVAVGSPLSDALNASGEFPSLVVRMVRIGEESGDLSTVLDKVADYYTKDVDDAVQGLITMIEPLLTAILGAIIAWIAIAVFGPIYMSFSDIGL